MVFKQQNNRENEKKIIAIDNWKGSKKKQKAGEKIAFPRSTAVKMGKKQSISRQ